MIYTSYFGQMKNFPKNFEPICIARWKPKWYHGKTLIALAPSEALLNWWRNCAQDKEARRVYAQRYYQEVLSKHTPTQIKKMVKDVAGNKTPVLLCFEKRGTFCHRNILRVWLRMNGIDCEEWE